LNDGQNQTYKGPQPGSGNAGHGKPQSSQKGLDNRNADDSLDDTPYGLYRDAYYFFPMVPGHPNDQTFGHHATAFCRSHQNPGNDDSNGKHEKAGGNTEKILEQPFGKSDDLGLELHQRGFEILRGALPQFFCRLTDNRPISNTLRWRRQSQRLTL
jgi:hypothetical protein